MRRFLTSDKDYAYRVSGSSELIPPVDQIHLAVNVHVIAHLGHLPTSRDTYPPELGDYCIRLPPTNRPVQSATVTIFVDEGWTRVGQSHRLVGAMTMPPLLFVGFHTVYVPA